MTSTPAARAPTGPRLDVIPLGGLGEFGMNMLLVVWDDTAILIDAGAMFPGPELLGVDLVIPDLGYLQERVGHLAAVVLTHGHEDHIGALPYVWPLLDGPVYGTPLTLALVSPKLEEHGLDAANRLCQVAPGDTVTVGDVTVEFIRVTHSMPDCVAVAVHTPAGTLVHTGDYKFDQTPLDDQPLDIHRFAELGRTGVLALFGDSTNIERPGFTGSELDVVDGLEEVFSSATGKIVIAAFASSLHRIQIIADLAAQFGRKLAFAGRGVIQNTQIAARLGHLRLPAGLQIRDSEVKDYPARDVVCMATGSQGEPLAALSRIAIDDHRHVKLERDDVVVFSARAIPGNRRAIGRVMNHIARRGAEVIHEDRKRVHVSGHGSAEELKLMLSLVRPRFFVPIHGEYRYLAEHARVAARVTGGRTTVLLAEDGDVIRLAPGEGRIDGRVATGRALIDGTRSGEVGDEVLRHRRHLAGDGVVVPVIAINRQEGHVEGTPDVITRGVVVDEQTDTLLETLPELLVAVIDGAGPDERSDQALLTERVRIELQRLFRKRVGRRPLVLPVIMEI
ncbi:MAG TPA: ribonuclease J [Vicinamibacterales bacterium]|jgi:ribonuclease J|nr:ribonuclease J [Vicinamibacterales bacterium]|tara:strand:- start:4679 stop:6367 length:1689 start_codon:yes stop_codon:yes gene_type:complete